MITGEIKTQIDNIWDTFWTGGITNSITILEQMTYLFFMKMLDDAQLKKESSAALLGVKVKDPVFEEEIYQENFRRNVLFHTSKEGTIKYFV